MRRGSRFTAPSASGSAAIRTAWMAIQSGLHDVVAVIGCQKMTELETAEILALRPPETPSAERTDGS